MPPPHLGPHLTSELEKGVESFFVGNALLVEAFLVVLVLRASLSEFY